jgi:hypothetical protein
MLAMKHGQSSADCLTGVLCISNVHDLLLEPKVVQGLMDQANNKTARQQLEVHAKKLLKLQNLIIHGLMIGFPCEKVSFLGPRTGLSDMTVEPFYM